MSFWNLGLSDDVVHGVQSMGYIDPTPIQLRSFPIVLSGRDLIGSAQTGTGKTGAFALPVLSRLGQHGRCRCLVLEPTRELADQVKDAFTEYGRFGDLRVTVLYGGVGYGKQKEDLQKGVDIIVATPGRLLDHLEQGTASLKDVNILILDEVDRMLDMGFLPDVRRIVEQCPKERQTLFFSATVPPEIERLTSWVLKDPLKVEIGIQRSTADTVKHAFYPVAADQKFGLLQALLDRTHYESCLIFTRTKHGADKIAASLEAAGHTIGVMHSNRTQAERTEALEGFKSGKYEVMVATDIAARGIDVSGITHVINYDVPLHPEDYVHRIGRTGRAMTVGDAFTLITADELKAVESIERFIGQKVPRLKLDNFNYLYTALFNQESAPAAKPTGLRNRSSIAGRKRR